MIQANDFIAKLRMEPDNVLKQMADMHQNDPYLFPMIFQEAQARKDMRAQAQAKQQGQATPTTKEQDLQQIAALDQPQQPPQMGQPAPPAGSMPQAPNTPSGMPLQGPGSGAQMLPEQQGIGALPAQNLTKMAGGGITGVASPEHHYAGNYPNLVSTNPNGPGGLQYYFDIPDSPSDRTVFKTLRGKLFGNEPVPAELNRLKGQFFKTPEEAQSALTQAQFDMSPSGIRKAAASSNVTNLLSQNQPTPEQETNNLNVPLYSQANNETAPASTPAAPWSPGIVAPQVSAAGVALGPKPTATGSMRDANTFYDPSGIQNLLQENVTERGVLNTQNALALDKMIKARPNLGGDYEKRLRDQEAKEPEKIENLKGMSMLEAGLAIMGGNSPYAMQNIARGVEGVKSYKEGLKDLEKAHDLRDQAFAHIDDTRKALQIGDQNLAYTSQVQANDKFMDAKEHATSGYANALGVSGKMGADLFTNTANNYAANQRTNAQLAGTLAGVNAQLKMEAAKLNLPPEQIRSAMYLGNGDIEAGMNKIQELSRDKSGIGLLTALSTVNAKRASLNQPDLTMDEFLSGLPKAMAALQTPKVVSGANPNAVLARPGMQ